MPIDFCYSLPIKDWKNFKSLIYSNGFVPRQKTHHERISEWDKTVDYYLYPKDRRITTRITEINVEFCNKPRHVEIRVYSVRDYAIPKEIIYFLNKRGYRRREDELWEKNDELWKEKSNTAFPTKKMRYV